MKLKEIRKAYEELSGPSRRKLPNTRVQDAEYNKISTPKVICY